ncbi:uncharacterized protein EV420DRAFT_788263 [Desarmillaria tabescens]|uniref:Protein kinase domain-containing protein n=1 Tax=Armillaria tabescens TaxID=1929756 RepID=A0AA39JUA0_ARMTA|nr:uncharacterized protein EV420DRAFT_788263 [Desarmillaria tabescens]KAK0449032.1 hypothetical protein EV420DRAFT_788263 [Desarmillaria tabescens]
MADSEIDLVDQDTLRTYYEELVERREKAFRNPLREGCSFPIDFDPHPPGSGDSPRPLPLFAVNGGSYRVILTYAIVPYRHDKQLSQIWIADVISPEDPTQSLGKVVLKIVQPSLLPLPDIEYHYEIYDYLRPWVVSTSEEKAYGELKSLEGTTIPYFYGLYPVMMPNGEDSDVLVMEYIEGKSLKDWLSERKHAKPEDLGDREAEYVEDTKRIFKKAIAGIHSINKLGVAYCQLDETNIILTPDPSGTPVFIDFALTNCHISAKDVTVLYINDLQVSYPLRECCETHNEVLADWVEEEIKKSEETWFRSDVDEPSETT